MKHDLTRRVARAALWLPIAAYALLVIRHFFHLAGSAVFISTDDSLANISYALATEGRYGFLSSPTLEDMARDHGLFSYGPYYFFIGGALIWLFGYSLTIIRSIHLGVILAISLAGRAWFGRVAAGAAGAIMVVGLLVTFDRAQWPMARPDSVVSLFAVALVVCAGLAMRTGRARYWLGAGFAAASGAFTHLVAWSLVPAVVMILGISLVASAIDDGGRWHLPRVPWGAVFAAAAGGLGGTFLFYASFGFRFRDQIRFLAGYQQLTGSMASMQQPGSAFWDLLLRQFTMAYWYLAWPLPKVVWATLGAGILFVLTMLWGARTRRREALALVAPPVVVWTLYLLSLGVYNNFHTGYGILNQVMWLWTLASLATVFVTGLDRWPRIHRAAEVLVWLLATALGVGVLTILAQRTEYRALADASFVPIDRYIDRVLEPLPARARTWGTIVFGIENPGRIQLVQFREALDLVDSFPAASRPPLAPDYVLWGSTENTINILEVLKAEAEGPRRLGGMFPNLRYSLVAMTDAVPYGVTRVYARSDGVPALDRPMVNLYDPTYRQWSSALGSPAAVQTVPAPAARMQIGSEAQIPARSATQTLGGELLANTYLLRVRLASDLTPGDSVILTASATEEIRDTLGQFGPDFDVSPWFPGERDVYMIFRHHGGRFYVSQFGTAHAAMTGIEASVILPLADYTLIRRGEPARHPIAANQWVAAYPEIRRTTNADGTVAIVGNTTKYGYQAYGPDIPVEPGDRMRLRVDVTVSDGHGCIGVLDGSLARWLVAPDRLEPEYEFQLNDTKIVRPVLADCSSTTRDITPMRATIRGGSYAHWSVKDDLYVDLLMRARQESLKKP